MDYLIHHGVKGMKWGIRRYQDSNGNWTEEGLEHRRSGSKSTREKDDKHLKDATNAYIQKAKDARTKLTEFDKHHPELTERKNGSSLDDEYNFAKYSIRKEKELENKLGKPTMDLLKERNKLYEDFNEASSDYSTNDKYVDYYNSSKKYIEKYGHESYQKLLGDDANLYYTNNWRVGLDDLIDYDSGNFYYRNLSEELW